MAKSQNQKPSKASARTTTAKGPARPQRASKAQAKRMSAAPVAAKKKASKAPVPLPKSSGYWLFKSEPDVFSWDMQVARAAKGEPWTGVRNYMARNNMRAMNVGDLGFFYHSNIGKEIVGIVRVIEPAYPEPGDETGTWMCVTVEAVRPLPKPVSLQDVKSNDRLKAMSLVTCMRLSVQPVSQAEWQEILAMGGLDPHDVQRAVPPA